MSIYGLYTVSTVADSGFFSDFYYRGGVKSTVSEVFEDLKFKMAIFQTFWKNEGCAKFLFCEILRYHNVYR